MSDHLAGITAAIEELVDLRDSVALDIGSNDATLLRSYGATGVRRIGIDPTAGQFRAYYPPDAVVADTYFTADVYATISGGEKAKAITSIAMFYDLPQPHDFVDDVARCLHPDGVWVLEQSYLPTMLMQNSFDTICQEHLEYYALRQIDMLLAAHELRCFHVELNDTNGGSFRVYACHANSRFAEQPSVANMRRSEDQLKLDDLAVYRAFHERSLAIRKRLLDYLTDEKTKGRSIYLYGASTKGNLLLQFCGIDRDLVTAAADRNPAKRGRRTPATGIPILTEEEVRAAKPDIFLVLPWHFRDEFIEREKAFLADGGKFVFPLPEFEIVGGKT